MFSPNINELLLNNRAYAERHGRVHLDVAPSRKLAVVTCMDSRMDVFEILGLRNGEAHVIRNAGGVITDDVIRSLCLSQRVLGTAEILLIHHTDCGLQKVTDDSFKSALEAELGVRPQWAVEAFTRQVLCRTRTTSAASYTTSTLDDWWKSSSKTPSRRPA